MSRALDRRLLKRARYLARTTSLSHDRAEAVALAERGYSDHGIAREVGVTPGTVTGWLDDVADRYGPEAVYPKMADERGDLTVVVE